MKQEHSAVEHFPTEDEASISGSLSDAPELVIEDDENLDNNILQMETSLDTTNQTELTTHDKSPMESAEHQFSAGVQYIKSQGNHYLGAKWFRKAGMQGHAKAQFYLGLMFIKGEGVPKSLFHAYSWLSLACCQNYEEAKIARKNLEPFLTAAEMNAAMKLAAERIEQIFEY